jgi:diacylglycerol kinase (ATP)
VSGTLVIVNPNAAGGRAGPLWDALAPVARGLADVHAVRTTDRAEATATIHEAVGAGTDRVVILGGDGTIHVAVNALLDRDMAAEVVLGLVPAGTGSDLARVLNIPRNSEQALETALRGAPRRVDAGRCRMETGIFHFCNIASAGVSGLVDVMVNANPRRGRTAFLRATLRALRAYRCLPLRATVDGAVWYSGPAFLLAVANGTTFGKGMRIAPGALLDDGLFDLVLVGEVAGFELLRRLPQVYLGRHVGAPQVQSRRGTDVVIEPLAKFPPLDVDGETYPSGVAHFTLLPGALRFAGGGDP